MDYDGHIIENNKLDNAFTYKKSEGYYPVLCSINKLPVYLQNRNGNTPESYNQKSSIAAALEQCIAQKLTVNKFRADACCYEKDTIQYLGKITSPTISELNKMEIYELHWKMKLSGSLSCLIIAK